MKKADSVFAVHKEPGQMEETGMEVGETAMYVKSPSNAAKDMLYGTEGR